ncbi:hypothetical protein [Streptomyces sp. CC224B]|uniref:hypothetical protein n=1 Tax=Streptomyces sp. CC224B TaxID=3044571 RepID=UPI0024A95C63|nr:hypothetical protein [Streptomyces sp. CC224B]
MLPRPSPWTWQRQLGGFLRALARDDRGMTSEHVIWIAFAAALALAVTGLFGPQIMAAARSVSFR